MPYTDGQILKILTAVKYVLMAEADDVCDANVLLLEAAVDIGLVTEDECNLG